MRSPDDPSAPAPAATHEPAGPLDRDAVRDGDLSNAAFGIFGLAGLAIVAVASVWFLTRPGADEDVGLDRLFATENAPVPADAPMLRSGFDLDSVPGGGPGGFTFLDGATGEREVIGTVPAPASARADVEPVTVTR
ncbi:hypothetical protein NVS89_08860 [Ancylobacter sp. MQZ15Z-1]|uniref:Uncharacterized protein n=1 Tax=Ancylobacter mangrovi TaxID=2972472 RepID=A0A9X2PAU7_9HYPH|nr:hypothetical protein [Ancylobacter mangrovi]MCS0495206.1 hypothetical protein [Ancylobacter mangrovi]